MERLKSPTYRYNLPQIMGLMPFRWILIWSTESGGLVFVCADGIPDYTSLDAAVFRRTPRILVLSFVKAAT